jgi:hypothetical protein
MVKVTVIGHGSTGVRKVRAFCFFIATLPVNQRENVRGSWMDFFMPTNARQQKCLDELVKSSLFLSEDGAEDVSYQMKALLNEVKIYLEKPEYKTKLDQFKRNTVSV